MWRWSYKEQREYMSYCARTDREWIRVFMSSKPAPGVVGVRDSARIRRGPPSPSLLFHPYTRYRFQRLSHFTAETPGVIVTLLMVRSANRLLWKLS